MRTDHGKARRTVTEDDGLTATPLTASIGSVVTGLDLHKPIDSNLSAQLRSLLLERMVLILPGQHLSDDDHVRLAEIFGTPNINPNSVARGITHPLEWIEDTPESPPKTDIWHTDVAYSPTPPNIAVLANVVAPPYGGDTMWIDLYGAHDLLSPAMQRVVESLTQDVDPGEGLRETLRMQFGEGVYESVKDMYEGTRHPLVRVHPDTGKRAIFLCGAYHRRITGMTEIESAALMGILRQTLHEPAIQCRWRWHAGDIAIWDERCTNHRGLADHYPMLRKVRRCTVGGDQPFGPLDERAEHQVVPPDLESVRPTTNEKVSER